MQEFSKKRLLKTKNKSFFDLSVFIGCFDVLKSEIKNLDIYKYLVEVSHTYTVLCVTHDSGEKFSQIFINTGK